MHDDAIELLTTLLERKPDCLPALMLRGVAKRETGRLDEAMTDFARADGLDPNNEHCLFELAGGWYTLGNRRPVLEYCERGRRAAPASTRLFALLAQIKLGGEFYFQVLARILDYVKPGSITRDEPRTMDHASRGAIRAVILARGGGRAGL